MSSGGLFEKKTFMFGLYTRQRHFCFADLASDSEEKLLSAVTF
jgi:hypothetical protein